MKFTGSITALITPFRNGKFDESAFQSIIENQINSGTHGLVPTGTTGGCARCSTSRWTRRRGCGG